MDIDKILDEKIEEFVDKHGAESIQNLTDSAEDKEKSWVDETLDKAIEDFVEKKK